MRIALLHPCYWPEVRRGSERLIHDLGQALAERGHQVTLLTSSQGPGTVAVEDGIRVIRSRRPPAPAPLRWYEDHLNSTLAMGWHLLRGRYDLAHAFHPASGWAAAKLQRAGAPPLVFSFHGIPERGYVVSRRYRMEMLATAIAAAGEVTVLSEAAAEHMRRYLLRNPMVIPGGVRLEDFDRPLERRDQPTIVCAASLGDPRKRGELLLEAFSRLRRRRPEFELRLVKTADPWLSPRSVELGDGVSWVAGDDVKTLSAEYAQAHASVLPSIGEAFGLVAVESLAAGTPVVAGERSAPAEVIEAGTTGELFSPDDAASLDLALERAVELGGRDRTRSDCKSAAEPFDCAELAGDYETIYERIAAGTGRTS